MPSADNEHASRKQLAEALGMPPYGTPQKDDETSD